MTYLESVVLQIRTIINDLDETDYTYSDERITQLFLIAACQVLPQVSDDTYVIDLENLTIVEEPDKYLTNLINLKSACLLLKGESKSQTHCNVKIVDGPSTIHMGDIYKSTKEMADDFCSQYEKEKAEYLMKNTTGLSLTTPVYTSNKYC